jgi:hypothetical protein
MTATRQICIGCGGPAYGFYVRDTDKFVCSSPCFASYRRCNSSLYPHDAVLPALAAAPPAPAPAPAPASTSAGQQPKASARPRAPTTLGASVSQQRRAELPATPVRPPPVASGKPVQSPKAADDSLFVIVPSADATDGQEKERRPPRVDSIEMLDEDIFAELPEQ